jgi:hypothetical protein
MRLLDGGEPRFGVNEPFFAQQRKNYTFTSIFSLLVFEKGIEFALLLTGSLENRILFTIRMSQITIFVLPHSGLVFGFWLPITIPDKH